MNTDYRPEAVKDVRIHRGDAAEMREKPRGCLRNRSQALGSSGAPEPFSNLRKSRSATTICSGSSKIPRGRAAAETSDR